MKKLFGLILLVVFFKCTFAQNVTISQLSTYIGNSNGGWVPVVINGVTRKIDAGYFHYLGFDSCVISNGASVDTFKFYNRYSGATFTSLYTPPASSINGHGFVKAAGDTLTYDNSTYLTTTAAASTYLPSATAASTYLTIVNAASTYLTSASNLAWGKLTGLDSITVAGYFTNYDADTSRANIYAALSSAGGLAYPHTIKKYLNGYGSFASFTTDSIPQGNSNFYFTPSDTVGFLHKADSANIYVTKTQLATKQNTIAFTNAIKNYTNGYGLTVAFSTDSIPQGTTNLYFTPSDTTGFLHKTDSISIYATATQLAAKQNSIGFTNTVKKYLNGYGAVVGFSTDSIPQGTSNLYFTASDTAGFLHKTDSVGIYVTKTQLATKQNSIAFTNAIKNYVNGYGLVVPFTSDSIPVGTTNLYFSPSDTTGFLHKTDSVGIYLTKTQGNTLYQAALSGTGYLSFSGSTPTYSTATQVTAALNLATASLQGLVPASGGGTSNFLRSDLTWAAPPGGGTVTYTSPASSLTITGSGSNTLTADINGAHSNEFTTTQVITYNSVGTTLPDALYIVDSTAATSGATQYGAAIHGQTRGWITGSSASVPVDYWWQQQTANGSVVPTNNLILYMSQNGGTKTAVVTFNDGGGETLTGTFTGSNNIIAGAAFGFTWGTAGTTPGLYSDATYEMSIRQGTHAEQLQLYNTYTSSSVFEDAIFGFQTNANELSIGTATTGGTLRQTQFVGGMVNLIATAVKRTTVADAAYTILTTDYLIAYTSLTAARTVTLPTAVSVTGQEYIIKDESGNAATDNITVATTSSQTIDGSSTKTINTAYGVLHLYSNGSNWLSW